MAAINRSRRTGRDRFHYVAVYRQPDIPGRERFRCGQDRGICRFNSICDPRRGYLVERGQAARTRQPLDYTIWIVLVQA